MNEMNERKKELTDQLMIWYGQNARELPWRIDNDPYHVWISEIMLQQTRVEAVIPYFERFFQAFPTLRDLAEATEDQYLKIWEGLGYYSRIRNIHKTANLIIHEHQGKFPEDYASLIKLPGIGPYTAAAIASICFQEAAPAIDGNLLRIFARLNCCFDNVLASKTKNKAFAFFEKLMPAGEPGNFNQALMDLGAMICLPIQPKCAVCPIQDFCCAKQKQKIAELPVRIKKQKIATERMTVLLIHVDENILLRKRPAKGLLADLYEFPNLPGYISAKSALQYAEDLGLKTLRIKEAAAAKHVFSHKVWLMNAYEIFTESADFSKEKTSAYLMHEEVSDYKTLAEHTLFLSSLNDLKNKWSIPSAFETYKKYLLEQEG